MGMYLWLAVFNLQPHKEERFLYPIYPLIVYAAAEAFDCIQKLTFKLFCVDKNQHYLALTNWMSAMTVVVASLLALSRMTALYTHYNAPTAVWSDLSLLPLNETFVPHSNGP